MFVEEGDREENSLRYAGDTNLGEAGRGMSWLGRKFAPRGGRSSQLGWG